MHGALLTLALAAVGPVFGSEASLHGRASGWLGLSRDTSYRGLAGLRYLPEAQLSTPIGGLFTLDAEASVNGFVSADARTLDRPEIEARIKPYRGFVRLSSARFEARAGLQKINFGSAMLLRPLMWFDRVDPRDPLAMTDGVYGLLARYYFQNNINIWAWGLLGNGAPKGWEVVGSERWTPEPGARVQVPIPLGEVAATYHHRTIDYGHVYRIPEALPEQAEDRLGLDAKVDVGIGLCLEGTISRETRRMDYGDDFPLWTHAAVAGADYTFGIGSGLGVVAEHMILGTRSESAADSVMSLGSEAQFSALMVSYPLGLLDNLRTIVYFDWTNRDLYSFLGWQRTTDNWTFSLSAFANPDRPTAAGRPGAGAAGKGLRFDVVFNH
jgi:hypothetical protein